VDGDLEDRYRAAVLACTDTVVWHPRVSPAESFAALAQACSELGLDEWDGYGDRGAVAVLEQEVAELLGKPAGVFFPSGNMGQQAALRVWCERRRSLRVAIPDLAHQLHHEGDGPRILQGFRFELLTTGRRTATAADLRALPEGLGAVQLELPLREAGCLLPTWEELAELSTAARELGVPLHVDGARIWESQPFYDRPLAEIAALADTVYVSFYKGLGGLAGAVVVAEADVAAELRLWRTRMGGTIFRMTPFAVSALVGLRSHAPRMGEYAAWARSFAAELVARGLTVTPQPPHTNTFQVFAAGEADEVTERVVAFMERELVVPCGGWRAADVPGLVMTEVTAHAPALAHDPAVVAGWYAALLGQPEMS
jgi:threonine aldolase